MALVFNKTPFAQTEPPVYNTVSGPIVSISNAKAGKAKSVIVGINPVQSGSGDPSPTNIRPISGFTGVNIWDDPKHGGNIVWNQLVTNGDFSDGTTGWIAPASGQSSLSVVDGTLVLTHTVTSNRRYGIAHDVALISGHKYLLSGEMKKTFSDTDPDAKTIVFYLDSTSYEVTRWSNLTQDQVVNLDTIFTASISAYRVLLQTVGLVSTPASNNSILELTKPFMIFDLTVMFGSGNEPTTVDEFKALFPKSYYSYNDGSGSPTCVSAVNGDPYSVTPVSWQSSVGTVYGGTVNLTTGKLTVTKGYKTFNSSDGWTYTSGAFYQDSVFDKGERTSDSDSSGLFKCNLYKEANYIANSSYIANRPDGSFFNQYVSNSDRTDRMWIKDSSLTSLTDLNTALAQNPLQVVYPLATPIEYDLTPTAVTMLAGYNNLWADTGDIEVTYRVAT